MEGGESEPIRERPHRLPRHCYVGKLTVMFTLCVSNHKPQLVEPDTIHALIDALARAVTKKRCVVPIFTFMPDHMHLLITGQTDQSDVYGVMLTFTRYLGMWHPELDFQRSFYDRIIRWFQGIEHEAWYIANNPLRARLTDDPLEWPFTGSIGCDLRVTLGR